MWKHRNYDADADADVKRRWRYKRFSVIAFNGVDYYENYDEIDDEGDRWSMINDLWSLIYARWSMIIDHDPDENNFDDNDDDNEDG